MPKLQSLQNIIPWTDFPCPICNTKTVIEKYYHFCVKCGWQERKTDWSEVEQWEDFYRGADLDTLTDDLIENIERFAETKDYYHIELYIAIKRELRRQREENNKCSVCSV